MRSGSHPIKSEYVPTECRLVSFESNETGDAGKGLVRCACMQGRTNHGYHDRLTTAYTAHIQQPEVGRMVCPTVGSAERIVQRFTKNCKKGRPCKHEWSTTDWSGPGDSSDDRPRDRPCDSPWHDLLWWKTGADKLPVPALCLPLVPFSTWCIPKVLARAVSTPSTLHPWHPPPWWVGAITC
jgi:hypothetical protein